MRPISIEVEVDVDPIDDVLAKLSSRDLRKCAEWIADCGGATPQEIQLDTGRRELATIATNHNLSRHALYVLRELAGVNI